MTVHTYGGRYNSHKILPSQSEVTGVLGLSATSRRIHTSFVWTNPDYLVSRCRINFLTSVTRRGRTPERLCRSIS